MATVLIADDIDGFRNALAITLRNSGYRVLLAADGRQALHCTLLEVPDLAILDINLSLITGTDVCKQLRAEQGLPYIPIIITTQKDNLGERVSALEAGCDDIIAKSMNGRELVARIEALLRMKKAFVAKASEITERTLPTDEDFTVQLNHEFKSAEKLTTPLSVMLVNLTSSTNSVSDTQQVLHRAVSELVRSADFISLCRGADIGIILPNMSFGKALAMAEKLSQRVASLPKGGKINIGVACYPSRGISGSEALLGRARISLERARSEGAQYICLQHHQTYLFQPETSN